MPRKLVLVESPAKAATLARLLGDDFTVKAVPGNLRDFPPRSLGVGPAPDFEPQLTVPADKRAAAKELTAAAAGAEAVLLAHDPGSDGEFAAWNAAEVIAAAKLPVPVFRVRCPRLAADDLHKAVATAGPLDRNLVYAHLAHRILDRMVAYRTGPFLWKSVKPGLPASRLQAAVLRAQRWFVPGPGSTSDEIARWEIGAEARGAAGGDPFRLRLVAINGKPAEIRGETNAAEIRSTLDRCTLIVSGATARKSIQQSPPPFTTPSLLQAAAALLGIPPARTMAAAQRLHEGVDTGSGNVSLITFPATESAAVPYDEVISTRAYIRSRFGAKFAMVGRIARGEPTAVGPTPSRHAISDGFIGAIRPMDVTIDPEGLRDRLDPLLYRVYALVWRRFVASQMASAKLLSTTVLVNAAGAPKAYRFRADSTSVTFPGHRIVSDSITPPGSTPVANASVEALAKGDELHLVDWTSERVERTSTVPHGEADLLADLVGRGLGRPLPLLGAINALRRLECLTLADGTPVPTELGSRLCDFLGTAFPSLFSDEAVIQAESCVDDIAEGAADWRDVVRQTSADLEKAVETALAPPLANPEMVDAVLFALDNVVNWESAPRGKNAQRDEDFFAAMKQRFENAEDGDGLTERQFDQLLQVLCHYRAQIPNFIELVRRIGRYDLLELPDNAPDAKTIRAKMEWVDKAPLSPESKRFVESLKHQADGGRHLTGAQVRVLDEILAAQALRIPGLTPEILQELGITPRTQADIDNIQRLLDTLAAIKNWRPPSQRGKRTYDDQAFTASVREQFERRGDLSPAQLNAVKRMVARYHEQIPDYAEVAARYDLPPEGLAQPTPGRRRKKPLPAPDPATPVATAPTPPPAERNPVEDL